MSNCIEFKSPTRVIISATSFQDVHEFQRQYESAGEAALGEATHANRMAWLKEEWKINFHLDSQQIVVIELGFTTWREARHHIRTISSFLKPEVDLKLRVVVEDEGFGRCWSVMRFHNGVEYNEAFS